VVSRLQPLFLLLASPINSAAWGPTGRRRRRSTRNPSHEQLLMRLGVGSASGAATDVAVVGAQGRISDVAPRGGFACAYLTGIPLHRSPCTPP
jgi:hypothetical protein